VEAPEVIVNNELPECEPRTTTVTRDRDGKIIEMETK